MHNLVTTRIHLAAEPAASVAVTRPWLWPLPRLDGDRPCILSGRAPARPDGSVEIGFRDRASSSELVPVFAPQDGALTYAGRSQHGGTICVDHPGGWSTLCSGLEILLTTATGRRPRRRRIRVRRGDVLGHVRAPLRLGFALSRWVDGERLALDPGEHCHDWTLLPWFTEPRTTLHPPG